MYIDNRKTNHFTLSKYDSIPNSLGALVIRLSDKKFKPLKFKIINKKGTLYFIGNFEELNISVLNSFLITMYRVGYPMRDYPKHLLMNQDKEIKFELTYHFNGGKSYKTYKLY